MLMPCTGKIGPACWRTMRSASDECCVFCKYRSVRCQTNMGVSDGRAE